MKKIFALTAVLALMCVMTSCGDKKDDNSQSESSASETSEAVEIQETTSGTEHSAQTTELTSAQTEKFTTVEKIVTTTSLAVKNDDLPAFQIPAGRGIVFTAPIENTDDADIIAAAQLLFDQACEMEWNFTVGSPYEVDQNVSVKNSYGWDCYLITADGINSLADVRLDYHKIFSENYKDHLEEVFTESNGRVYCLCGERGSDIFYIDSEITSINSISDSEISFTVTDSYSDDDLGGGPCTKEREFTISKDSDRAWRVSRFILPY